MFVQVGRIIDLTNTWRYYSREEIDELGIEHLKVNKLLCLCTAVSMHYICSTTRKRRIP